MLTRKLIRSLSLITCAVSVLIYNIQNNVFCAANYPLWNDDWDNRKHLYEKDVKFYQSLNKPKPIITRNIFLVRNGQCSPDKEIGLTHLGMEQAAITGQKLCKLKHDYNRVIAADGEKRSMETARIISEHNGYLPLETTKLLCDGNPIQPLPATNWQPESSQTLHKDATRFESAFQQYFYRNDASNPHVNDIDILVCSANVIRYFICRVLQCPPEAWRRFSLFNCSITWVMVADNGAVALWTAGDFGHLPMTALTL